ENGRGQKVQGTLTLPANYEEGKTYPTIIYFYETMSDRHHQYAFPRYDDRPHMSTYASNGYAVFMPDILFEEGRPGTSSLDGISAAVQAVIDEGVADPDRIGLQGHSWGGYQSSFIVTQTDIFKAVVTGAPPTNLESFYNNIYGNTGTNHHGIMEIGQVRMGRGVTPWTHRALYQEQNPMFHVPNISTPFMILHGTDDGAVDWSQGLEFYNAARRMGKEVIFLSYPGEGHHLRNEANSKDFLVRMMEYFDYYVKGEEPADWILDGVPHLQKKYEKAK
ncbi:MAG: prolyl oligopeptidase family serine peptidase, partial [Bacteroidota bacterium]